jgi:outer membrane protein TolC
MTRILFVGSFVIAVASAAAAQPRNPFLGSTPSTSLPTTPIRLSLEDAIDRGLRYNLGLVESDHVSADARSVRLGALATLMPTVTARAAQVFERLSLKEVGLTLPGLPAVTDPFQFQDARISVSQAIYSGELRSRYRAGIAAERAAVLDARDARDVVVLTVGAAYLQIQANVARLETALAQRASAEELDRLSADRLRAELAPEIDALRSQVERQIAEQRVVTASADLEKSKAALARAIGLEADQPISVDAPAPLRAPSMTEASATEAALQSRADLASARASVDAAEFELRAARAEQQPTIGVSADYGGGGDHTAFNQVYSVAASVSVPIYTGGRIRAHVLRAESELTRRRAEYDDLRGRVAYDVHIAWLDLTAATTSLVVAESNKTLADRALVQAQDRYANGVTNYLEVVQAQETVAHASENRVATLYAVNVAKLTLARAIGGADAHVKELFRP